MPLLKVDNELAICRIDGGLFLPTPCDLLSLHVWFYVVDRLRDTLIHEMCHAAAWVISGIKAGHGPIWKSW